MKKADDSMIQLKIRNSEFPKNRSGNDLKMEGFDFLKMRIYI